MFGVLVYKMLILVFIKFGDILNGRKFGLLVNLNAVSLFVKFVKFFKFWYFFNKGRIGLILFVFCLLKFLIILWYLIKFVKIVFLGIFFFVNYLFVVVSIRFLIFWFKLIKFLV